MAYVDENNFILCQWDGLLGIRIEYDELERLFGAYQCQVWLHKQYVILQLKRILLFDVNILSNPTAFTRAT